MCNIFFAAYPGLVFVEIAQKCLLIIATQKFMYMFSET